VNVCRFKHHIISLCVKAPRNIKAKYRETEYNQKQTSVKVCTVVQEDGDDTEPDDDDEPVMKAMKHISAPVPSTLTTGTGSTAEKEADSQQTQLSSAHGQPKIVHYVDKISQSQQKELDLLWAEAVYVNQWSFNSMNCPTLLEFFRKLRPSYRVPSPYKLSHGLLDSMVARMDRENQATCSRADNLAVMLDGWTDVNNKALVNVAVYADVPIFAKSLDPGPQRHNAEFIAESIIEVIEKTPLAPAGVSLEADADGNDPKQVSFVDERKFRSVVTNQPAVMTAAWRIVENSKPWVNCYGCGAHVVNLLAGDFTKVPEINAVLESNRKIATVFRTKKLCKEVLKEATLAKCGKQLNVELSCKTRWSTDYFMLARNLRIKEALITACVDPRIAKEMRSADLRNVILSDSESSADFWKATERAYRVFKPLKTAIQFCEGDSVPVSVMPRIWQHISYELNTSSLQSQGFSDKAVETISTAIKNRRDMNTRPVTVAANVLDPRFCGQGFTEAELSTAYDVIIEIAKYEQIDRSKVLGDLAEYRSKTGAVFGSDLVWEATTTEICAQKPSVWWSSYASQRVLSKVALILLAMPATAAAIERCNKSYSIAKTKLRNRLSSSRAASLAQLAYDLSIQQTRRNSLSRRSAKRQKRSHILALPVANSEASSASEKGTNF